MTLRLGLIGAGRWGRAYIETLREVEGVRLSRVASANPETKDLVGPGCDVTGDWRGLVDSGDLDGVVVATPPALHAEMTAAALARGLPVMVEKPLTMDPGQAEALCGAAEDAGVFVLVDHVRLFHPAYAELKRRAQALGPVRHLRSAGGSWGPFRADATGLWDWGPHSIAACLDLVGETPDRVSAERTAERRTADGPGENVALRLGFPCGAEAEIEVGTLFEEKRWFFTAAFDGETLTYDDIGPVPLRREPAGGGKAEAVPVAADLPLSRAVAAFAAGIRAKSRDGASLRLGADTVAVLARCQEALDAG